MQRLFHPGHLRRFLLLTMLLSMMITTVGHASADLNIIIHSVQVAPVAGRLAYQVSAYVSVLDTLGSPVRDLAVDNFGLMEDSQEITFALEEASKDPISLVMVMDTSGSMSGAPLEAAKKAASDFVNRLGTDDSAALATFDKEVKFLEEFTTSPAVISSKVQMLSAVPNSGTCLYDAAYQAVEKANLQPPGRRAIVLLTDGKDINADSRTPCSAYTLDDVLKFASNPNSRVPVYTIGLGNEIARNELERMANLTGGEFLESPEPGQLSGVFELLSNQLRYQYKISYISESVPGQHTMKAKVSVGSLTDEDTQDFALPEMPVVITFSKPSAGEEAAGTLHVEVSLLGKLDRVAAVQYSLNTRRYDPVSKPPYAADLDLTDLPLGEIHLHAVALDANQQELGKTSMVVNILPLPATAAPTLKPSPVVITATPAVQPTEQVKGGENSLPLPAILAAVAALLVVIALVVVFVLRHKKQKQAGLAYGGGGADGSDGLTMDFGAVSSGGASALLKVLQSDDPNRIGEVIRISNPRTTIGRSDKNDVSFPQDRAASRNHAVIFNSEGQFTLCEMQTADETGAKKWPTYGTYVNGIKVLEGGSVSLTPGAEIRLGNRLKFRFEPMIVEENDGGTVNELTSEMESTKTLEIQ